MKHKVPEARFEGEADGVPKGVDLSVYRLVQEGLTNVIKHAGPARATVTVRYEPRAVEVEVVDDGRGAAATPPPSGRRSGRSQYSSKSVRITRSTLAASRRAAAPR